jgi:hypothetical protein
LDCLARYARSYHISEGSLVLPVWQKL